MSLVLWEIWSYLQILVVWAAFRKFAHRDIKGGILAGAIIGVCVEFITEPFWQYHFKITVYKDIPLSVIFAWGVMFSLVIFLSEKLYCWFLKKSAIVPYDKRVLLFDVLAGVMIGLPFETVGIKTGIWEYRYDLLHWNWGFIPFFHMPYEALVGYALLMVVAPTFVRYWQGVFAEAAHD